MAHLHRWGGGGGIGDYCVCVCVPVLPTCCPLCGRSPHPYARDRVSDAMHTRPSSLCRTHVLYAQVWSDLPNNLDERGAAQREVAEPGHRAGAKSYNNSHGNFGRPTWETHKRATPPAPYARVKVDLCWGSDDDLDLILRSDCVSLFPGVDDRQQKKATESAATAR